MTQGETLEEEIPECLKASAPVHMAVDDELESSQYCYGDVPVSIDHITDGGDITSRYVLISARGSRLLKKAYMNRAAGSNLTQKSLCPPRTDSGKNTIYTRSEATCLGVHAAIDGEYLDGMARLEECGKTARSSKRDQAELKVAWRIAWPISSKWRQRPPASWRHSNTQRRKLPGCSTMPRTSPEAHTPRLLGGSPSRRTPPGRGRHELLAGRWTR